MKTKAENSTHLNIFEKSDSLSNRETLTAMFKSWRQKLGYFSIFALPAMMTAPAQETRANEANKPEMLSAGQNVKLLERLDKSLDKPLRSRSSFLPPHQKRKSNIISELAGGDDCPGTPIPGGRYTAAAPFIDSGDTTGANNTVTALDVYYYFYSYEADGPDQIYSFTISGLGPNPQIQVSATSATYKPMIYILYGEGGCPAGTNNSTFDWFGLRDALYPGGAATLDQDSLPLNIPLYLFIDSRFSGANDSGPYTLRIQDITVAPAAPPRAKFDFDGDGRADVSVFRPSNGYWYLQRSGAGFTGERLGNSSDRLAPADFDGDGRTDIAIYRNGLWIWFNSSSNYFSSYPFGAAGDIPVPADFTGDGRAELAVFRDGVWYTLNLSNRQVQSAQFGLANDKPVVADYDGDGRADYAVFRDGVWYLSRSQQGFAAIQFGLPTDKPVPADYDGDGKTDQAVFRDGVWYLLQSAAGFTELQFGVPTNVPAAADYDGDGRADVAVFRNGVWYMLASQQGLSAVQFGFGDDKPIPAAYIP